MGDKVIETDTDATVFTNDGSESTFYAFQFTNFYKILYSAEAANNWVRDFAYAHVVNGKGKLTHNSYRSLKGVPDVVALEPEHGGYYYKYSYPTATHFASSNTVVLSNTNIKYSSNNFVENAYVYSAVVNQNGATEFGLISCAERNGKWYAYSSVNKNIHLSTNPIILPTQNAYGVFTTNATVEIQLYLSGKTIMGRIVSGSNVLAESGSLSLKGYNGKGSSVMFLQACSLVRDTENITFDLRDGSYFKNISFTNCKLYGEIEIEDEQPILENGEDFYSNSENTSFAFLYNDDCITRSDASTSTKEIFSIDYSVGYQQ